MAKIDKSLQLTSDEIGSLMETEPRLRIATIGPGLDINLTPMTFGWAGGCVYIFARGQKVANLRRNNTAAVLVDVGDQWPDLKGVMLRGNARVLETEADELADRHLAQAQRNLGAKHGLNAPYEPKSSGKSRRWIVFEPHTIVSWDNSKLVSQDSG